MKALSITMNAFGPYRYKQKIDFSEMGEESIFLITGPTGAGKTTIFDAMCFALYGRASGSDRDQDAMRSHFAEPEETTLVDFQFELRGKEYRVVRMPKQVKRKERGEGWKEVPARAELYMNQADEEQLLASKIKEVNDHIESLMGLDYEQFRKMIMIPQGEFRKLISENSKEREEILQRIFKTQFYDQLTDYLKQQSKSLEKDIEQFQWKIDQEVHRINWDLGNDLLENEEPKKILSHLDHYLAQQSSEKEIEEKKLATLNDELYKIQEQFHKAKQLQEQFSEYEKLQKEKEHLYNRESIIQQLEDELGRAQRAFEVMPYERQWQERYDEWQQLITSQKERKQVRQQKEQELHALSIQYEREEKKEEHRQYLKKQWEDSAEKRQQLEQYLDLDKQFEEVERSLKEKDTQLKQLQEKKQHLIEEKESLNKILEAEKGTTDQYYEAQNQKERLSQQEKSIVRLATEYSKLSKMRSDYQKFIQTFNKVKNKHTKSKSDYETALEEVRKHHAYTLALELEAGSPCPVCGSSHHPETAVKPKGVVSGDEIDRLKEIYEQADRQFQQIQEEAVKVKSEGETQRQVTESLYKELESIVEGLSDHQIQQALNRVRDQLNSCKKHLSELDAQFKEIEQASSRLQEVEENEKNIEKQLDIIRQRYNEDQQEYVRFQTQLDAMKEKFSFETTNTEELDRLVAQKEQAYQAEIQKWEDIQKDYHKLRDEARQVKVAEEEGEKYIAQTKAAVDSYKQTLDQTLIQYQFSTIQSYHRAILPQEEMQSKQLEVNEFKQRKSIVEERHAFLQEKLSKESRPQLESIESKREQMKLRQSQQQQRVNEIDMAMKQNRDVSSRINNLLEEQGDLAKQYFDIAELAQLAKGDNHLRLSLERYVLASFLDEILIQANIRLDQMTDHRYQLIRSDEVAKRGAQSGLDLEVLDHHTGQQRSVRTLSGGEGFKASLSLALGMADIVQSYAGGVQLDTLFIDEGFGTLDEISLEQAIDCLRGLQDGNRMLGIISHVAQLKEEIPAKLQITASQEGSSVEFMFQ